MVLNLSVASAGNSRVLQEGVHNKGLLRSALWQASSLVGLATAILHASQGCAYTRGPDSLHPTLSPVKRGDSAQQPLIIRAQGSSLCQCCSLLPSAGSVGSTALWLVGRLSSLYSVGVLMLPTLGWHCTPHIGVASHPVPMNSFYS